MNLVMDHLGGQNATGDTLIRAGAPEDWDVSEKSLGAGAIRNDVAILQRPERGRIILVVLTERHDPADNYDDPSVADVSQAVLSQLS